MNIEFESSQQQEINDTPITHLDETRENGSDSNFIFEKVRRSIRIKPTQPKSRYIRQCHYRKKPCGLVFSIEIFIAVQTCQISTIFMFAAILRYSSGRSVSATCLTDASKTITNKEKVNINVLQFK